MPTIAYFYGIAIRMFFQDHPPLDRIPGLDND
jgi:hypothetical protein